MMGWYFPGATTPAAGTRGRPHDRRPDSGNGRSGGRVACQFDGRMRSRDVNEFVDGYAHEARSRARLRSAHSRAGNAGTFTIDEATSRFNYLRVNPATGEAEMRYHIEFATAGRPPVHLRGHEVHAEGWRRRDAEHRARFLQDYTTLYCHVYEADGGRRAAGDWDRRT